MRETEIDEAKGREREVAKERVTERKRVTEIKR